MIGGGEIAQRRVNRDGLDSALLVYYEPTVASKVEIGCLQGFSLIVANDCGYDRIQKNQTLYCSNSSVFFASKSRVSSS